MEIWWFQKVSFLKNPHGIIKQKKLGIMSVSCVYIGVLDIVTKGHLLTPFLPVSKYEPKSSFDVQD